VKWKLNATNSGIVASGNANGNQNNQFFHPTDVVLDQENHPWIIADHRNRRVTK
jgi:hypothetical protein